MSNHINILKEDILRLDRTMDGEKDRRDVGGDGSDGEYDTKYHHFQGISKAQEKRLQDLDKRLREAIEEEQRSRRESENELVIKLKSMTDGMRHELDEELKDKEATEESALRTCIEVLL
ncbi:hypothetical protein Pmar_PMAR027316 [Perkinsus marinus ATCC 50983]|uniref:Uncharacterized protein n=1 Tax=Perkinsus marinus (strain ATCC 50983 / TXsc) TaxID=423536 RepID=C5KI95_PERM5|nr:hypothetical protein Pmar_PMAR027316 [Perkinsus marinus ATCC 50983]EER15798.1 hypothetical protein Pmar_PMAR027316 [Perkinsus marinus ATCC 50983]|eukprot:XP_002784002.1 hypothetical protein Pmar_PMAR027316 [Perkinsus marinus ATCC 50983]